MSIDLVKELRAQSQNRLLPRNYIAELTARAADEIERLQDELKYMESVPEGEGLQVADYIVSNIEAPALHVEMMELGNKACQRADELARKWKEGLA